MNYPGIQNDHELPKAHGASELRGRFGFQDARPSKGRRFKANQVKLNECFALRVTPPAHPAPDSSEESALA